MPIRTLKPQDALEVARVHSESISEGFISGLGPAFIETVYKEISKSKNAFGFVCENESKIVGFICGSLDTNQLFKELILSGKIVSSPYF